MNKTQDTQIDDNLHWYKDAIIYELHIKAFMDSNGDGIGDFEGLLEKLDYLEDLGVTAIWLLPFYPSPLRDDGYDIADYYKVNPSYGTIEDFQRYVDEAHKRDLRVITELVINHTSDQHPWFQKARKAPKGSKERDYYVWSDDPHKYKDVRIIFQDFEKSNWTYDPVAEQYYWHRFYSHQPDLNFDNPDVQQEVFKMLDYWLDMGVDGFRLDAVPYLFEREGTNCENLPETHKFLKKLRTHVDEKYPGKLLLAEANMWPEESAAYFGDGDECHMNYHFPLMPRMFMSVKMEDRYPIIDILEQTPEIPDLCQWAMFLRNHDELTLEMVTDEERDFMYRMYTKEAKARINLGIRQRLAPLLDNDRRKIELLNVLLFSMPGTPVVYYGDEIGMGDNYHLGDRDGVRTPMQWNADRNAGFSRANPHKLYLPVNIDPEFQYNTINVEAQNMNSNSLLWWMKRLIAMRKKHKAFSRGSISFLHPSNSKVLAFLRSYEGDNILVIANLSRHAQSLELDLKTFAGCMPVEVYSQNKFPIIKKDPYQFTLAPYSTYWFKLTSEESMEDGDGTGTAFQLELKNWEELKDREKLHKLESNILPKYLKKMRWFGGKGRSMESVAVEEFLSVKVEGLNAGLMTINVNYHEGLSETYSLPVAFGTGRLEDKLKEDHPQAQVCELFLDGKQGTLFDALYHPAFREALLKKAASNESLRVNGSEIGFDVNEQAQKFMEAHQNGFSSKILSAEQSNTSIVYENSIFLKLYRKLERMANPDVEINRYLTEKTDFANVPAYIGTIEHRKQGQEKMVLGMFQELIPNQGDAWEYMLDVLHRYYDRVLSTQKQELPPLKGELTAPVEFNSMPQELQELLGGPYVERVLLLAERTAEMHAALAAVPDEPGFEPEPFSLHYQRSIFSSLTTLLRTSMDSLKENMHKLNEDVKEEAQEVLEMRKEIQEFFKQIFDHKIDTLKIRTHGDYHLGQVLFTGKDFIIIDFEGEPARPYSQRRLKRSPLRDVAGMVRSFHYAAYSAMSKAEVFRKEDAHYMEEWAEQWYHYISGFYVKAYMEKSSGQKYIPDNNADINTLLQIFLLEKAVYELSYELNNRPDWVYIPLRGIKTIMKKYLNG